MNDYILDPDPPYEPDLDRAADEWNQACIDGVVTADMMDAARPDEEEL